jgi:hypothetical protein
MKICCHREREFGSGSRPDRICVKALLLITREEEEEKCIEPFSKPPVRWP